MIQIALRLLGVSICAFVAVEAFDFYAIHCVRGCHFDWVMFTVTTVFFFALSGALYLIVRRVLSLVVLRLLGVGVCASVALLAFSSFATYCAWGCPLDWIVFTLTAVFFFALLGALYLIVRIVLGLVHGHLSKSDCEGIKRDVL
jgi:hypothetical protein